MKAVKTCLWVIGVLVVLTLGTAVVLVTLVDPNDYKAEIAARVKQHTGRDLLLRGDLELVFYPWLGMKTGPLELSNREGFGPAPMLAVEQASLTIKLLPLLKKRVEIDTVLLNAPQITLSRNADGTANWDDLTAKTRRYGGLAAGGKPLPAAALAAGLVVRGVSVRDGRVSWDDRSDGRSVTLKEFNLNTGRLVPGVPLDIDLSFAAKGNVLPEPAVITLTTTARLTENLESISLDNTKLEVETESISANLSMETMAYALRAGLAVVTGLRGDAIQNRGGNNINTSLEIPALDFNLSGQSLQLPSLTLAQDDFVLSGSMNGSEVLTGIPAMTLSGEVDAQIGDVAEFLRRNNFNIASSSGLLEFGLIESGLIESGLIKYVVESAAVRFDFKLAGKHLKLTDLTVKSLEDQGGQLLAEHPELDIPFNADGTLNKAEFARTLMIVLRAQVQKKVSQWLLEKIAPTVAITGTAGEPVDPQKTPKKTLKNELFEAPEVE